MQVFVIVDFLRLGPYTIFTGMLTEIKLTALFMVGVSHQNIWRVLNRA